MVAWLRGWGPGSRMRAMLWELGHQVWGAPEKGGRGLRCTVWVAPGRWDSRSYSELGWGWKEQSLPGWLKGILIPSYVDPARMPH